MFVSRVLLFSFLVALSRADDAIETAAEDAKPLTQEAKEIDSDHAPSESVRVVRQFPPQVYPAMYPQELEYVRNEGIPQSYLNERSFLHKPAQAPQVNILPLAVQSHAAHSPVIPTAPNCQAQQPVPVTTYTPVQHTSYVPVQHTAYVPVQHTAYKPTTYYAQPPPAVQTYSAPPASYDSYAGAHAGASAYAAPIIHSGVTAHQAHPGLPCLQNLFAGHPLFQKSSQPENSALYFSKHLVINNPKTELLSPETAEIQIRDAGGNEDERINLDTAATQQQIAAAQFQPYQHQQQFVQRESPVESNNYV